VEGGEVQVGSRRGSALSGTLVIVAGVLAGTAGIALGVSAPTTKKVSADLAYLCSFPSGDHVVGVDIAATLPASAAAGKPVQPTGVRISAGLSRQVVADLARLGATSIAGSAAIAAVSSTAESASPRGTKRSASSVTRRAR